MKNTDKIYYCYMLVFSEDLTEVLLLTKMKGPSFLIGKLTGVGGKLEPGETALAAAEREFDEEAGLKIPADKWKEVLCIDTEKYKLDVFTSTADITLARTNYTEEIVEEVSVHKVSDILAAQTLAPEAIAPDLKDFMVAALVVHAKQQISPIPDGV